MKPSPQKGKAHSLVQPSVLISLPSSQASTPARTIPSPQTGKAQAFVQPSVFTWLPSSQASTLPTIAISANWPRTGIRAGVRIHLVAIIAGFHPARTFRLRKLATHRHSCSRPCSPGCRHRRLPHLPELFRLRKVGHAQAFVQPSVFTWLPSSQASTLPEHSVSANWQRTGIRAAVCVTWLPSSQASTPARTIPSPQTGKAQAFVQPSVFTWLPSSQASLVWLRMPSPQVGRCRRWCSRPCSPGCRHRRLHCSADAITATWQCTSIRTAIRVHLVAIIAGFHTCPNSSVSANWQRTGIRAAVCVHLVAIIAGFHTCPNYSVSANWPSTGIRAAVCVHLVAIIAGFHTCPLFRLRKQVKRRHSCSRPCSTWLPSSQASTLPDYSVSAKLATHRHSSRRLYSPGCHHRRLPHLPELFRLRKLAKHRHSSSHLCSPGCRHRRLHTCPNYSVSASW